MKQKLIILLEDDQAISEMVFYILSNEGYLVRQCTSVDEFNNAISQYIPDLCVMDISLPDGSGLEVCKRLKEDVQTASIPVLVMSAKTDYEMLGGLQYHDDFISKPFDIFEFKKKVRELYLTTNQ